MSNVTAPLTATITGGRIYTSGTKANPFTTIIEGYQGEPLFCKAYVHGSTLVLLIDEDGPSDLRAPLLSTLAGSANPSSIGVGRVSVTVRYQTSVVTWAGVLAVPYQGGGLDFQVGTVPNLSLVSFTIREQNVRPDYSQNLSLTAGGVDDAQPTSTGVHVPDPCDFTNSPPVLGYIAIEVDGLPGQFQVYYIDNPPTITHYTRLRTATIVPPACNYPNGSIGGPMGIQLTSS